MTIQQIIEKIEELVNAIFEKKRAESNHDPLAPEETLEAFERIHMHRMEGDDLIKQGFFRTFLHWLKWWLVDSGFFDVDYITVNNYRIGMEGIASFVVETDQFRLSINEVKEEDVQINLTHYMVDSNGTQTGWVTPMPSYATILAGQTLSDWIDVDRGSIVGGGQGVVKITTITPNGIAGENLFISFQSSNASIGTFVRYEYECEKDADGLNTGIQLRRTIVADGLGGETPEDWEVLGENLTACPLPYPAEGTFLEYEYICETDLSGNNTGNQLRREVLADGHGGQTYSDWANLGQNLTACPLPYPAEGTLLRQEYMCEKDSNNNNTGIQLRRDITADGLGGETIGAWESLGEDLVACPLPYPPEGEFIRWFDYCETDDQGDNTGNLYRAAVVADGSGGETTRFPGSLLEENSSQCPIPEYTLTVIDPENGHIISTPEAGTYPKGTYVNAVVTVPAGYEVDSIYWNGSVMNHLGETLMGNSTITALVNGLPQGVKLSTGSEANLAVVKMTPVGVNAKETITITANAYTRNLSNPSQNGFWMGAIPFTINAGETISAEEFVDVASIPYGWEGVIELDATVPDGYELSTTKLYYDGPESPL